MALGDETNWSKEMKFMAAQVQEIEDALWNMYDKRNVNYIPQPASTTRDMLDDFGDNAGQPRRGFTDANYSIALNAKIQANKSCGEPEGLIAALKKILLAFGNTTPDIHYHEGYPMTVYMSFAGTSAPTGLLDFIQRIAGAGVHVVLNMRDPTLPFLFDSATNGFDNGLLTEKL